MTIHEMLVNIKGIAEAGIRPGTPTEEALDLIGGMYRLLLFISLQRVVPRNDEVIAMRWLARVAAHLTMELEQ